MISMCGVVDKERHIPVDLWGTEEYPMYDSDYVFKHYRNEIVVPIRETFFSNNETDPKYSTINEFSMTRKRSYNSNETRDHICKYLNYFEKFYDRNRILVYNMALIKFNTDYIKTYTIEAFMDDVKRYIICHKDIATMVARFVDDNYLIRMSSNNNKTPNLQYNNEHAKILYEISLLMNMYIPLASHYMYIHNIKSSEDIQNFMLRLFDICIIRYNEERGIDIYNKIYETAASIVNKSKNPDKILWEKNQIRGNNTTTHTKDSVIDVIMNIIPKYSYEKNIIHFNHFSNRRCLTFRQVI